MKKIEMLLFVMTILVLVSCVTPTAETAVSTTISPTFLAVSDVHLNKDVTSIHYNQDTGTNLWDKTLTQMEGIIKEDMPEFIIYLGDLPCHTPQCPVDHHADNIRIVLTGLHTVTTSIPLLYVPGNNDSLGGDYDSFTSDNKTPFATDKNGGWPMVHSKGSCSSTLKSQCIIEQKEEFGYYSAYPTSNTFRVIVLNTIIFGNDYHSEDGVSQLDAATGQFSWFVNQLDSLAPGEKLLIAMHIPPGKDFRGNDLWLQSLEVTYKGNSLAVQDAFLDAVTDYKEVITGILTSHTHMDEIRQLKDSSNTVEVAISIPGISPNHGNNPGMKLFSYDSSTYELMDFTTYYTTVPADKANSWQTYTSYDVFGCKQGDSLFICTQGKSVDDLASDLLQGQNKNYYVVLSPNAPSINHVENGIEVCPSSGC